MIEKLPNPARHPDEIVYDMALKLNEVIEELNAQHHSIQTLNSISKKLEYLANPLHGAP